MNINVEPAFCEILNCGSQVAVKNRRHFQTKRLDEGAEYQRRQSWRTCPVQLPWRGPSAANQLLERMNPALLGSCYRQNDFGNRSDRHQVLNRVVGKVFVLNCVDGGDRGNGEQQGMIVVQVDE